MNTESLKLHKLTWEKWHKIHQELWIFIRDNIEKEILDLDYKPLGLVCTAVLNLKRHFFQNVYPELEIGNPYCAACEIEENIYAMLKKRLIQLENIEDTGCIFCPLFSNAFIEIDKEEGCINSCHAYDQLLNTKQEEVELRKMLCQRIIDNPWNKEIQEIYEMIVLDKEPDKQAEFIEQLINTIKHKKGLEAS